MCELQINPLRQPPIKPSAIISWPKIKINKIFTIYNLTIHLNCLQITEILLYATQKNHRWSAKLLQIRNCKNVTERSWKLWHYGCVVWNHQSTSIFRPQQKGAWPIINCACKVHNYELVHYETWDRWIGFQPPTYSILQVTSFPVMHGVW